MVKDKQGQKHNQPDEVMLCWEEHFRYTFPHDTDAVLDIPDSPADTQNPPTTDEIREAVKSMKCGKSPYKNSWRTDDTNAGKDKQTS